MQQPAPARSLTHEEVILQTIEDDTEESPWIVMGDPQMTAVGNLTFPLREYMARQHPDWYVASMLPLRFQRPGTGTIGVLGPDLFVAKAHPWPRPSYDLTAGEPVPAFVLEVLSPASIERDVIEKRAAYDALGVDEYVLFAPTADLVPSPLRGFRRDQENGRFVEKAMEAGRWWSDVLELWLVARGLELRIQLEDGSWLPDWSEAYTGELEALEREQALHAQVEARDEEIRQLRAELERRSSE